ncbi:MAG: methyltransferase domain-containing protein [Clostridia bacterium]|nr:methyltransferase domain-containing protein [Clostridia bacterium]
MFIIKNSLGQSHDIISQVVTEGDTVIDATAGNGNDTVFLAGLVKDSGKVYSFDIQQQALEKTKKRLSEKGFADRVELINDGHQNMGLYVKTGVKAVMFNLGYLPGGNHNIGTKGETTIKAIEKAMELLKVSGVISIVVYYGGDSGFDEKEEVLEYIKRIDFKKFSVLQSEFVNQPNCPPILVCIQKYSE